MFCLIKIRIIASSLSFDTNNERTIVRDVSKTSFKLSTCFKEARKDVLGKKI